MIKYLILSPQVLTVDASWMEKVLISLIGLLTSSGKKTTTASDKYMAQQLNVSHVYINRTLKKLKEKGLIETGKDLGRRSIKLTGGKKYIYMFNKNKESAIQGGETGKTLYSGRA